MPSGNKRVGNKQGGDRAIDRRRLLQTLGAATVGGLAGCGQGGQQSTDTPGGGQGGGQDDGQGGGQGGGGELGERVPTIVQEYWSNLGGDTTIMENNQPITAQGVQQLGVQTEIKPVEFTSQINNVIEDKRSHQLAMWWHGNDPSRLDPFEMTRRYAIDWAGGNGQANPANLADCDHSVPAVQQAQATSEDERRNFVNEAHSILSENYYALPLFPHNTFEAARADVVEMNGIRTAGPNGYNHNGFIKPRLMDGAPVDKLRVQTSPVTAEAINFPILDSSSSSAQWNHLIHSSLWEYNDNYELERVLAAEEPTVENDGRTITVTLKEGATFHNGDPITSEHVRFTYKHLWDNPGAFPQAGSPPYTEINTPDELTTEFNFENPFLPLISRSLPRWGIFHKPTWENAGAPENPEDPDFSADSFVGSGPFELVGFESGSFIDTEAYNDHIYYDPPQSLFLQVFRSLQTGLQAFLNNEIQIINGLSPGAVQQIENQLGDDGQIITTEGFMPMIIYPQFPVAPTKFQEFRQAVGATINRQEMAGVAYRGEAEPQLKAGSPLMPAHPWRPPEDMLTDMAPAQGDPEMARQVLSDAGWGWDDNDRLRYPPDADTSPRWPQNGEPDPSEFPCLDSEGEFQMPG